MSVFSRKVPGNDSSPSGSGCRTAEDIKIEDISIGPGIGGVTMHASSKAAPGDGATPPGANVSTAHRTMSAEEVRI